MSSTSGPSEDQAGLSAIAGRSPLRQAWCLRLKCSDCRPAQAGTRKEELNELLDHPDPWPDRRYGDATAGGAMVDGLSTGRGRAARHFPAAGRRWAGGPITRLDSG